MLLRCREHAIFEVSLPILPHLDQIEVRMPQIEWTRMERFVENIKSEAQKQSGVWAHTKEEKLS